MRKQYPLLLLAFLLLTTFAHATTCETWTEISGEVEITEPGCYRVVADDTRIKFAPSIDGNVIIDLNGHRVDVRIYECEIRGTLEIFNGYLFTLFGGDVYYVSVKEYKLHDLNTWHLWLRDFERLVIDNVRGQLPIVVSVTKDQSDVRINNYAGLLIIGVSDKVSESNVVITQSNITGSRARTASPSATLTLSDVNFTRDTVILWPADKLTLDNVYLDGRPLQYNNDPSTWEPGGAYLVDTLPPSSPVNVYYVGVLREQEVSITQDHTYAEHIGVYSVEDINGYTGTVAIYVTYIGDIYDSNVTILSRRCYVGKDKNTATIYNSEVTLIQPFWYGFLEIHGSELNAEGSTIHAASVAFENVFENNYEKIVGGNFYVSDIVSSNVKEAPMYLEMNYWAPSVEGGSLRLGVYKPDSNIVVVISGTTIDASKLTIGGYGSREIHFKDVTFTQPITIICYDNQTVYFEGTTNTDNVTVEGCTLGTPIEQPICETWEEISGEVNITEPGCYLVVTDRTHIGLTTEINGDVIINLFGHLAFLATYKSCEINGTLEIYDGTLGFSYLSSPPIREYYLHDLNIAGKFLFANFESLTLERVSGWVEVEVTRERAEVHIDECSGWFLVDVSDWVDDANVVITRSNLKGLRVFAVGNAALTLSDVNLTYNTAIYGFREINLSNVYLDGRPLQYNNDPSTWEPDGAYLVDRLPPGLPLPVDVYYVGFLDPEMGITRDYASAEYIALSSPTPFIKDYNGTVLLNDRFDTILNSNVTVIFSREGVWQFTIMDLVPIRDSNVKLLALDEKHYVEMALWAAGGIDARGSDIYAFAIVMHAADSNGVKRIVGGNLHVNYIVSSSRGGVIAPLIIEANYWTFLPTDVPEEWVYLTLGLYGSDVATISGTTIDAPKLIIMGSGDEEIHFKDVTFLRHTTIVCENNQTVYFEGTTNTDNVTVEGCTVRYKKPKPKVVPGIVGGAVRYLSVPRVIYVSGKINEQKSVTIPVFWSGVSPTAAKVIYEGSVTGPDTVILKHGKNAVKATVLITGSGEIGRVTFWTGPYKATTVIYATVLAQGALPVSVDGGRLLTIALVLAVLYFFLARR